MIPNLNKDGKWQKAASYCPISLTSYVGYTMNRMINQRLKRYMETNDLLAIQQSGFRQFRSTKDQTPYL